MRNWPVIHSACSGNQNQPHAEHNKYRSIFWLPYYGCAATSARETSKQHARKNSDILCDGWVGGWGRGKHLLDEAAVPEGTLNTRRVEVGHERHARILVDAERVRIGFLPFR